MRNGSLFKAKRRWRQIADQFLVLFNEGDGDFQWGRHLSAAGVVKEQPWTLPRPALDDLNKPAFLQIGRNQGSRVVANSNAVEHGAQRHLHIIDDQGCFDIDLDLFTLLLKIPSRNTGIKNSSLAHAIMRQQILWGTRHPGPEHRLVRPAR